MFHFTNEDRTIRLDKNEEWLDRPIIALKKYSITKKDKAKQAKINKSSNLVSKIIYQTFKESSKQFKAFINKIKKMRKSKKSNKNEIYLKEMEEWYESDLWRTWRMETSHRTDKVRNASNQLFNIIKKHLQDSTHSIVILMDQFIEDFWKTFSKVWNSDPIKAIYNQTVSITNGELSLDEVSNCSEIDYDALNEVDWKDLISQWFNDITTITNLFVDVIPLYYSGWIDKNLFRLIKEDLFNFMMTKSMHQFNAYYILFTFSRIATIRQEKDLLEWIKKSASNVLLSGLDKINILEELYNQINPMFRLVQIEPREETLNNDINYIPKNEMLIENTLSQQGSNLNEPSYLQIKYENGAEKIATLNHCQSPIEKILMVKWVSESIRQDNEIYLPSNSSPVLMWADTLISIFAYIIALSQNHLMYAHLFFSNWLATKDMKYVWEEGYYLCTLEASLSLLWEYQNRTEELMVTIIQYEDSHFKFSHCREIDDSNLNTSSATPTLRVKQNKNTNANFEMFWEAEEIDLKQPDFYISKSFFKTIL